VEAPGAANTPQVLTVFLQVLPAGSNVPPAVQPSHLVFMATAGGDSPGSQLVQVYNIVGTAKSFQSQVSADSGLTLITLPKDGTLDPAQPTNIVVQPITTSLNAGVYNGSLTLQFSDGTLSAVQVTVIVSNAAATNTAGRATPKDSPDCTPTKFLPALTTLGQTFTVSAGWPAALAVNVHDDCGRVMPVSGSVAVDFSNGDPPLSLTSQGGGSWESTWQTGKGVTGVTLTIHASNQGLTGDQTIRGSLASQQQPPAFSDSGIIGVASNLSFTALAPGSVISIFGTRLSDNTAQFQTLPLPVQLSDTQVFVTGTTSTGTSTGLMNVPLYYASENQVNALIPYEVAVDTSLQLLVQRGNTYSVPVQINTAPAQPGVFNNGGVGLILVFPAAGGDPYFASSTTPAHRGDTIELFCTGLGTVNPSVIDGAAPDQLTNTSATPQVMIGGQSARVMFSGLAPGFAGLYQVNAVVPPSVGQSPTADVVVIIDGQASPKITLEIQ
jgi:uncharacterized protein (TIGR03437 family)